MKRTHALAIVSLAVLSMGRSALAFNVYIESGAENRPEGQRYNARFVKHF